MSEYQYYEFLAIDRPLSPAEMKWLRGLSSRAEISKSRFVNTYQWGDFKGDPVKLMTRCFDAFVYVSNFECYQFMLMLPPGELHPETAKAYKGESLAVRATSRGTLLEFIRTGEPDDDFDEGSGWMGRLMPLRDALSSGDLRALYVAWLASAQAGGLRDTATEPPVPAGLGDRNRALGALAEFVTLDDDLLKIAAKPSPPLPATDTSLKGLGKWIKSLPASEKDDMLAELVADAGIGLRRSIHKRFRDAQAAGRSVPTATAPRRTVGELIRAWEGRM